MLSRQQKVIIREMLSHHKRRLEHTMKVVSIDNKKDVMRQMEITWGKGVYKNVVGLVRQGKRMMALGKFHMLPDESIDAYENMPQKDLIRALEVVVRIKAGNEGFQERNSCNTCMTGTWSNGECNQCTSQSYPGLYNQRLGIDVPTSKEAYLVDINYFFKNVELSEIYYDHVVTMWGDVALQKNVIEFIANNWDNATLSVLKNHKVKSQLSVRTRLSNRGIQHSHMNDGQLLKAVWFWRVFDGQIMKNKRNVIMKFNKTMKRISKKIGEDKNLQMAINPDESLDDGSVVVLDIEKRNRNAFRFFRDQFCGKLEKNIDRVRGQGGNMRVTVKFSEGDSSVGIELFNPDGSEAGEFIVTQEGTESVETA